MTSLVTGGAGFIGSHLTEALLEAGDEVFVVDDLSTGDVENIRHLRDNPNLHCFFDTVMNRELMTDVVGRCDRIFHLAAAVGVRLIVESTVAAIRTNVNGTEEVLELASEKGKTIVLTSSSEVYGKTTDIPFREDGDLVMGSTYKGRWSYACSKMLDEFLALAYWKEKRCAAVVTRLFNTVGPRQTGQYGMVVPRFVTQALAGEPLTVYGDGEQTRTFTWVSDVVGALIRLSETPAAMGEIFNIGSTEEIAIRDLAELVKEVTGSSSEVVFIPYEQAYKGGFEDMDRRLPAIDKIRDLIGYQPSLGTREILVEVADYFRKR